MGSRIKLAVADTNRSARGRDIDEALAGTRSIVRTCDILRQVGSAADGLTVTEVGVEVGLPKSSAHRYLTVLESQRFVERDSHNKYRLGLGILSLQSRQTENLVQRARPLMEAIRNQFNETVNLGVLSRNRVVYLEILESTRGVRHSAQKGDEDFVHSTALGKSIAARMSDREVLELLARTGMERRTGKTITDPTWFLQELAATRTRGYAIDDGENEPEARCVAVMIPGLSVPAALSVSGVAARFPLSELPRAAAVLKDAASRLSAEPVSSPTPVDSASTLKAATGKRQKSKRGSKRR